MPGQQMTLRRESAVPASAPYVGVDQLLYNEADGGLYVKLPDGQVRRVNVPPSDARVNAGDARGTDAVDFQYTRASADQVASGDRAIILAGRNNKAGGDQAVVSGSGCDASGEMSRAGGEDSVSSGYGSDAHGNAVVASGSGSHAEGTQTQATALNAHAEGGSTQATAKHSHAGGLQSKALLFGEFCRTSALFAAVGDAQMSILTAMEFTNSATPKSLRLNGFSDRIVLEDETLYAFRIMVVGRNTGADENAAYSFEGVVKRGMGVASVVVLAGGTPTVLHEDVVAWSAVVQADTSNGALEIEVTGEAGKTIRWIARIDWVKITIA